MRSLFENRRLVLLLAALALGALTVLAVSLNGVPFHEAQHFVRPEPEVIQPPAAPLPPIQIEIPLWKQLVALGLLLLLVALVMLLLSPQMRKRMFLLLIRGMFTVWAVYFLIKKYGDQLFGFNLSGNKGPQPGNDLSSPMPVFEPPQAASTFSYAISFVFALILLALLWALYRSWQRYIALTSPGKSLDDIARIARSSLDDLSSGRNSSDVIINCYLRMNDVVSSRRKLNREIAMTPREFALRLEEAGLPGEAVTQLTRLFEGVRYGDRKSAPRDVNEAVNCLKTILHHCGEPV